MVGDQNDYWFVEVVDDLHHGSRDKFEQIHSLMTSLCFHHLAMGCYIHAANKPLPKWGFKQIEVSCDKEGESMYKRCGMCWCQDEL